MPQQTQFRIPGSSTQGMDRALAHLATIESLRGLMRNTDPVYADQSQRVRKTQDTLDADYDLETRAPGRTEAAGNVSRIAGNTRRGEELRDAYGAQDQYFAQEPMRTNQEAASMRALRSRYTDPAMVKAQADIERARMQGQFGMERQGLTNLGGNERAAITASGRIASAQAVMDPRNPAVGEAQTQIQGQMPPGGKTVSFQQLQAFADSKGWDLATASEYARARGWVITQ